MSHELKDVVDGIANKAMNTISELNKWNENEFVPGNIVNSALRELVEIHDMLKQTSKIAGAIDETFAMLNGALKAPASATEPASSDEA